VTGGPHLVFPEGSRQTLGAAGAGDGSYLDLWEAKGGVFGGVDDVALGDETVRNSTSIRAGG
jgi:hypothetical protein